MVMCLDTPETVSIRPRDVHGPKIFGPARHEISRPFCGRPGANFGPASSPAQGWKPAVNVGGTESVQSTEKFFWSPKNEFCGDTMRGKLTKQLIKFLGHKTES